MNQLQDQREFVHRIGSDGRIVYVNDAWLHFAAENDWRTSAEQVIGSLLMQHIVDPETQHIYRVLIKRTLEEGCQARFNYRCDSPDCRRFMQMKIYPTRALNQVEFRSRMLHMEKRKPVALIDPGCIERSSEIVNMCGWCKAVRVDRAWIEVEQAVALLGLFAGQPLPRISHGICPGCSKRMANVGAAP